MSKSPNRNIVYVKRASRFSTLRETVSAATSSKTCYEVGIAYSERFYSLRKNVSTASAAKTSNDEGIALIAKPLEEPKSKQNRVLKYKYNGARVAKIKRINALRNISK